MFTKNKGKINAIAYGSRASNKKDKISLNILCYCNITLKKINDNYIIQKNSLSKVHLGILNNIHKFEICMYILYSLNKILLYNTKDCALFEKIEEILEYIDKNNIDQNNMYFILFSYIRSISIYLGIYEKISNNIDYKQKFIILEKRINEYFEIDLDYKTVINR